MESINKIIEDLKGQIAQLEEKLKERDGDSSVAKSIVWKPQDGETYYSVFMNNRVMECQKLSAATLPLIYFKTKEQAQRYADYLSAYARVRNRIAELNDGWVADFTNKKQVKFYVTLNSDEGLGISITGRYKDLPLELYLKQRNLVGILINEMKDDLMTVLSY